MRQRQAIKTNKIDFFGNMFVLDIESLVIQSFKDAHNRPKPC